MNTSRVGDYHWPMTTSDEQAFLESFERYLVDEMAPRAAAMDHDRAVLASAFERFKNQQGLLVQMPVAWLIIRALKANKRNAISIKDIGMLRSQSGKQRRHGDNGKAKLPEFLQIVLVGLLLPEPVNAAAHCSTIFVYF